MARVGLQRYRKNHFCGAFKGLWWRTGNVKVTSNTYSGNNDHVTAADNDGAGGGGDYDTVKVQIQRTTANSHIGHCTHNAESTNFE